MYFIKNLTDEKLEIYFSKEIYQKLPESDKKFIQSSCLFSGRKQCWRSRAKLPSTWRLEKWLIEHGFTDNGTEGQKLSFAEKVISEQEKAADRADRMDIRHEKATDESTKRWKAATDILSFIPPGQPILVGHHSEKRHRRDLERADNNMRKASEAGEKAEYYRQRYNNAIDTAEGNKYKNAGYLVNRIKECEARIRECERGLQGKAYVYSQPKEITEKQRCYWNEQKEEAEDKLSFMRYCLSLIQEEKGIYDKQKIESEMATEVKIKGRWRTIVRLNKTTISVLNEVFPDPESQKRWALKYNYGQIEEIK